MSFSHFRRPDDAFLPTTITPRPQTAGEVALIKAARGLVGTPFRHQGRIPGIGIDCIGVIIVAAREIGWLPEAFDVTGYAREPSHGLLERELNQYLDPDPWGPIVLMKLWAEPQHVGILDWDARTLIHAWQLNDAVVEHSIDLVWMRRIYRSYQWRS